MDASQSRALKYIYQNRKNKKIDKFTIIAGDFTLVSVTDKTKEKYH